MPQRPMRWSLGRYLDMAVVAMLGTVIAFAGPITAPDVAVADTNGSYIQPVYFVPQGARDDRGWVADKATKLTQAQWANWGLSFRMEPMQTWDGNLGCDGYDDPAYSYTNFLAQFDVGDRSIKYIIFGECFVTGAAATCYDNLCQHSNLDAMETEFLNVDPDIGRGHVGVVGHELGHSFSMPHENCGGFYPNDLELTRIGVPTHGTNSIMCQWGGLLAIEDPGVYWHRERMLYGKIEAQHALGCDFIYECSGGERPSISETPLTISPQEIRNANGDCIDIPNGDRASLVRLQIWDCTSIGESKQLHRFVPARTNIVNRQAGIEFTEDGFNIRPANSGWCFDVPFASPDSGAALVQADCGYRDNNAFYVAGETIRVKSSGLCLAAAGTANGDSVVQQTCDGSPAQRWSFQLSGTAVGDVNCDNTTDIVDALMIVQYQTTTRADGGTCPIADRSTQLDAGQGDADLNGSTDVVDALLIARCTVGVANMACPAG